jgi:hypothetical protein
MKKITYSGLTLVIAIAIIATATPVAEAHSKNSDKNFASSTLPFKMKLEVALSGKAHVTGKVESISGDSFRLSTWGGVWTVKTATSTKYSNKGTLALIKVGDYVQVQGKVSSTEATTLEAQHINDKSFKKEMKKNKDLLKSLNKKHHASSTDAVRVATVQSVATSSNSLSVKLHNGLTYLINTSSATKFFNRALNPINFSDIKTGHSIAAYGTTTSSTTLDAAIIHDLSL